MKDVVIGIDSSTTATKAIAWDAHGRALAQGRRGVPMLQPAPGRFEQNPQEWWISSCQALSEVLAVIPADRIAAVAVCNQRETFAPLDASGNAVRDGIVWLDERSGDEVAQLASSIGAARINGRQQASDIGLVINTADPYSVQVGDYYIQKRKLAPEQVLRLPLPVKPTLDAAEFETLRMAIGQHFGAAHHRLWDRVKTQAGGKSGELGSGRTHEIILSEQKKPVAHTARAQAAIK